MSHPMIYLDNHATTRVDPRVVDAMLPYFGERFGNPMSRLHRFGQDAADALDGFRRDVGRALGAAAEAITFTSGATESNRLAIEAAAARSANPHFVVSAIEHRSVLDLVRAGRGRGWAASIVPPGADGLVEPAAVRDAIRADTVLVSVMAANNEIGTIQPVEELGRACREAGVLFLCDATAAAGRIPIDVGRIGADFLSLSAHKFHGPKGAGALFARPGGAPALARPGTPNVSGIAGLATALAISVAEMAAERPRLRALRDRLIGRLSARLPAIVVNGALDPRLEGNLNVTFAGVDGRALPVLLDGLAVSPGSACATATAEPSHVLLAIGRSRAEALGSLRFGFGRFNTEADADRAAEIVAVAVEKLRAGSRFRSSGVESDRLLGNTSHADRQ